MDRAPSDACPVQVPICKIATMKLVAMYVWAMISPSSTTRRKLPTDCQWPNGSCAKRCLSGSSSDLQNRDHEAGRDVCLGYDQSQQHDATKVTDRLPVAQWIVRQAMPVRFKF